MKILSSDYHRPVARQTCKIDPILLSRWNIYLFFRIPKYNLAPTTSTKWNTNGKVMPPGSVYWLWQFVNNRRPPKSILKPIPSNLNPISVSFLNSYWLYHLDNNKGLVFGLPFHIIITNAMDIVPVGNPIDSTLKKSKVVFHVYHFQLVTNCIWFVDILNDIFEAENYLLLDSF